MPLNGANLCSQFLAFVLHFAINIQINFSEYVSDSMTSSITQEDFENIFKNHLKVETYSKSIDSLLSPRLLSKTDYSPYYQRNYVWDDRKASYFIESILLGTEVPPLIFFNNNSQIEVIDGRQRFETILRYQQNKFSLARKGLSVLTQLANKSFDDLSKKDRGIIDIYVEAKIRIIEFAMVNEPPLDKLLEDRVKKEIFSRYNTGITPLRKSELDNAQYDEDPISTAFKNLLKKNPILRKEFYTTFLVPKVSWEENPPIDKIMSFVRKSLVLPLMPIKYLASGTARAETLRKLYDYLSDSAGDVDALIDNFVRKVKAVSAAHALAKTEELRGNRLVYECLMWGLFICESEGLDPLKEPEDLLINFLRYASENIEDYNDQDYHYQKSVMDRYVATSMYFEQRLGVDLKVYIEGSAERKEHIASVRKAEDTSSKLSQLESLRLNKPDPARNSIEDIMRTMTRRRFLVRPSYQRQEVINITKASSIIESILLGISVPPIFVFKREDGVSEVIDGQQRVLTLLGFMGSEYIDENGKSTVAKNHKFPLRKLRILKELDGLRFSDLSEVQQNKIYDFQLYVVEIEQAKNPDFNPIDLFIRLNDRPYPIRENSFEMWNSWADYEIIQKLRTIAKKHNDWFYLKQVKSAKDRDRMENEELVTSLVFLEYYKDRSDPRKLLDVYQKTDRINARIGDKVWVSQLLQDVAEKEAVKGEFQNAIKGVESFVKKLRTVLLDTDKTKDELWEYLRIELDNIFRGGKDSRHFRRTLQDFYVLWQFLGPLNLEMVKFNRLEIKKEMQSLFRYIKNIPEEQHTENKGFRAFELMLNDFREKYKKDDRKLVLSEAKKLDMIRDQKNLSPISGAPMFLGDEIEVDHSQALSIGGKDELENLQITHKDENRSKGSRPIEQV
jgi:hypothetical protein